MCNDIMFKVQTALVSNGSVACRLITAKKSLDQKKSAASFFKQKLIQ